MCVCVSWSPHFDVPNKNKTVNYDTCMIKLSFSLGFFFFCRLKYPLIIYILVFYPGEIRENTIHLSVPSWLVLPLRE